MVYSDAVFNSLVEGSKSCLLFKIVFTMSGLRSKAKKMKEGVVNLGPSLDQLTYRNFVDQGKEST